MYEWVTHTKIMCVCVGGWLAENSLAKWRLRDLSLRKTGIEQEMG